MIKAMEHKYFQSFLTDIGLDSTSVVGADEWGTQMETMLAEMTAQLKAFDIAGDNKANLEPTLNSFKLALTMAKNKQ